MGSYVVIMLKCLVALQLLDFNQIVEATPKYTEEERIALVKFRELVKDDLYKEYMKSDAYLVRWLRTRNMNQHDAAHMLREAMKWRRDNKIDGIFDEVIYDGRKPFFLDGTDIDGSIVVTCIAARWDTRSFVIAGKRNVPIRYWSQVVESAELDIMTRLGVIGNDTLQGATTHLATVICDLQGYNLRQHACLRCFSVYIEWITILENYYPGYIKHFLFINAPRIFFTLLEFLKPVFSAQTANALKVYGQNKAEWYPAIIGKIIPPDQVRAMIGGTKPE